MHVYMRACVCCAHTQSIYTSWVDEYMYVFSKKNSILFLFLPSLIFKNYKFVVLPIKKSNIYFIWNLENKKSTKKKVNSTIILPFRENYSEILVYFFIVFSLCVYYLVFLLNKIRQLFWICCLIFCFCT